MCAKMIWQNKVRVANMFAARLHLSDKNEPKTV